MAKSLEELELAFKAQYPKVEKKRIFKKSPVDSQVEAIQKETTQVVGPEDMAQKTAEAIPGMATEAMLEWELEETLTTPQEEEEDNDTITLTILDLVFYGVLVLMIVGAIIFSREALGNQSLGGKSFYEVGTTSMQSVYPKGSLVFVKDIEPNALMMGDDITFTNEESEVIISRITEIKEEADESNNQVFVTLGVDEQEGNSQEVLANRVIGKVTSGIPVVGAILNWIGSNLWIVFAIIGVLVVALVYVKVFRRKDKVTKKD